MIGRTPVAEVVHASARRVITTVLSQAGVRPGLIRPSVSLGGRPSVRCSPILGRRAAALTRASVAIVAAIGSGGGRLDEGDPRSPATSWRGDLCERLTAVGPEISNTPMAPWPIIRAVLHRSGPISSRKRRTRIAQDRRSRRAEG